MFVTFLVKTSTTDVSLTLMVFLNVFFSENINLKTNIPQGTILNTYVNFTH